MELLRHVAFAGGEWVIWVLAALSVLAVAVALERAFVFWREGVLSPRQIAVAEARLRSAGGAPVLPPFMARRLFTEGRGEAAAGRIRDRLDLERRLVILGTLGALAPFVGLFGTVLGIIRAFRDLAQVGAGHPEIVMQGIAEALIATALGILVAVVSLTCYNLLNRRIKEAFAEAERLELLHGRALDRGR